jgi:nitrogen fixation protein FixH
MRKIVFVSLLVLLAVLLSACGGSASMPMKEATSAPAQESAASKDVNIVVTSNPSPATVGDVEVLLTITDKSGMPIEGAKVDVNAEHPSMAGMGMSGQATEQGGGKYSIKANFSDSGMWMLTVKVTKDSLDYKEDIEFVVQ